jgi:DNA-binding XRE family transcriptional regulator
MSIKYIERAGRRYALIPAPTYSRMLEQLEELDDIRAYDRAKARRQEFVPAEMVDRVLAGESPIRVWREHRSMSQAGLAEACGVSKPYLSQLEGAKRAPSIAVAKKLAAALAVDVDDLI